MKKHGYKAQSTFKRGLNALRSMIGAITRIPTQILEFLISLFQKVRQKIIVA